jgi:hypothetical protein
MNGKSRVRQWEATCYLIAPSNWQQHASTAGRLVLRSGYPPPPRSLGKKKTLVLDRIPGTWAESWYDRIGTGINTLLSWPIDQCRKVAKPWRSWSREQYPDHWHSTILHYKRILNPRAPQAQIKRRRCHSNSSRTLGCLSERHAREQWADDSSGIIGHGSVQLPPVPPTNHYCSLRSPVWI